MVSEAVTPSGLGVLLLTVNVTMEADLEESLLFILFLRGSVVRQILDLN